MDRVTAAHRRPPLLPALLEFDVGDRFAAQRLAELMERDPLMSRRIHHAFVMQGDSREAAFTARDAIQRVGVPGVHCNVSNCGIAHALGAPDTPGYREYWTHAAATGVLATLMSSALRVDYYRPFLAGILMGVGRLLLAMHEPDAARSTLDAATRTDRPLQLVEREHLGYASRDLGRAIAEAWALPDTVIAVFDDARAMDDARDALEPASIARRSRIGAIRLGYHNPLEPPVDPASLTTDEHFSGIVTKYGGRQRLWQDVVSLIGAAQIPE